MPQSQRQLEERQMRKERILSGALQVFKKNGIDGATMDKLQMHLVLERQLYIIILNQKKMY